MRKFVRHLDKYKNTTIHKEDYYRIISDINFNYVQYSIAPNAIHPLPSSYDIWQNQHEIIPIVPTIKKTIEADINNIADLLKIIDENPKDPHCEYNIDISALHNIKTELQELNDMVGLTNFKQCVVEQLLYFIQKLHIGSKDSDFKHTVLTGPPGTGKTEIAKILGTMYSKLGVLTNGSFKKATRSDLVAGYLGQTAIKTQKAVEAALGGVLFIDEAYSLGDSSDMFSRECVDTLCECLSNYKHNLMVIVAGYDTEINELFFKMNPGLKSRFIWRFHMDPYTASELHEIFIKKIKENEWDSDKITKAWFEKNLRHFENYGRDMEMLFTYTKIAHGRRIYGKPPEDKKRITEVDLDRGFKTFLENKKKKGETANTMANMYI